MPINPPSRTDVIERLYVIQTVSALAVLFPPKDLFAEMTAAWTPEDLREVEQKFDDSSAALWGKVRAAGLWRAVSSWERQFAETSYRNLGPSQHVHAGWRGESMQVLLWALGFIESLGPPVETIDGDFVSANFKSDLYGLRARAKLRPIAELEAARKIVDSWQLRSKLYGMIDDELDAPAPEEPAVDGVNRLADLARAITAESFADGTIDQVVDEDFAVRGRAYRDLSREEWYDIRSVTVERHWSLNWLCGLAPGNQWDDTPLDV